MTSTVPARQLEWAFDFQPRTRIVCEQQAIDRLGELSSEIRSRRSMIVTDPGIVATGHVDRALSSLQQSGIETCVFDGARENPTTIHVGLGVTAAKQFAPDLLIGLGGGSSMDCAKGINFVYSGGGRITDYWGIGKAKGPMLPMIAIPTTAGTGSELQSFALISDADTHMKMACGDKRASCRVAILDPCLTLTQPPSVTSLTGVDALSHAIETFVTTKRNPISSLFSRASFELLARHFAMVLREPDHLDARAAMQLGAACAGLAIENSMLGASHALANPLTATYGIPHGQAVGLMLPHVIRFNSCEFDDLYGQLIGPLNLESMIPQARPNLDSEFAGMSASSCGSHGERLASFVTHLIHLAGLETKLTDLGIESWQLDELSRAAAQQWTGNFNPRPVAMPDLHAMYAAAM